MFLADGRQTNKCGTGELSVRFGSQNVNISALVADIEDSAIFLVEH